MPPAWASSKPEGSGSDCPRFRDKKKGFLVAIRSGQVSCLLLLSIFHELISGRFTSAASGAPMLLRDADVSADYPKDVDDENITHQGLSPTLPGELTKISSALALFKGSRILAKTLEELYPASTTYQLSLKKLRALSDELDQWSQNLPCHLRLEFLNDKPSTGIVSCRSPLLVSPKFHSSQNTSLPTNQIFSRLPTSSSEVSSIVHLSAMGLGVLRRHRSWLQPTPPSISSRS